MILKMYNELTNSFLLLDGVESVTVNRDYTPHVDEEGCFAVKKHKIMKVVSEEKIDGDMIIPAEYKQVGVKKNTSFIYGVDYFLFDSHNEKFKGEDVYSYKLICVNDLLGGSSEKKFRAYFLPQNSDVFVLNENGKTVDRL